MSARRVFVTNIPLNAYVDGWVEVPEGTTADDLQDAIKEALLTKGFTPETQTLSVGSGAHGLSGDVELDEGIIKGGWEFLTPMEET
jgi:hypothetical protein